MNGIKIIDTGRGWGVLETAASGLIRFIEDSAVELFSNAARAWGLAIYATEVYGSVHAAEHRVPASGRPPPGEASSPHLVPRYTPVINANLAHRS